MLSPPVENRLATHLYCECQAFNDRHSWHYDATGKRKALFTISLTNIGTAIAKITLPFQTLDDKGETIAVNLIYVCHKCTFNVFLFESTCSKKLIAVGLVMEKVGKALSFINGPCIYFT